MKNSQRNHQLTRPPYFPISLSPCFLVSLFLLLAASACTAPVRVEWSTETEMNTAGFNLFRGESAEGPFPLKVNAQLIPPAADPLTGGEYSYVDSTAQIGQVYYYQLQEVEKSGSTNSFGPIRVQAGGLDWRLAAVLIPLGLGVLALWVLAGKRRPLPKSAAGGDSAQS